MCACDCDIACNDLHFPVSAQAVFSNVKGEECVFLWRAIGSALISVVPTISYSLKVYRVSHRQGIRRGLVWHKNTLGNVCVLLTYPRPKALPAYLLGLSELCHLLLQHVLGKAVVMPSKSFRFVVHLCLLTCLQQEASEKNQLGDKNSKLLNVGLVGASLGHVLVLVPLLGSDYAGHLLPLLLGVWGTSLAVSGLNLFRTVRA
jgi:hypothetical protein